jgi:general secretion pathway protein N|tara:strand:+ start:9554 stop:10330 length:777 start_codon:yes stop_codon:yes gene_type:complete
VSRRLIWLAPLLGVTAFIVGLVAMAPAATLWQWAPQPSPVQVERLSGTVLNGRLQGLTQQQRRIAEQLAWRWRPTALFGAAWGYTVEGQVLGGTALGRVKATPWGSVAVDALRAGGDVRTLLQAIGQGFLPVNGRWHLNLDHAAARDQWPTAIDGTVTLTELTWALGRNPIVLGNFEATLSDEPGDDGHAVLVANLKSLEGPLELEGVARQRHDRSHDIDLRMRPRADAPPIIRNLLNGLGQPDANGWYHLKRQGRMP